MISAIISRLVILVFGTLYPAYASYKAVRTKNLKEYVKWMMYWIVFALFTCTETFTDVFLSWFPFYYEVKIVLVLWLLSPATKGSSILYRKFVHPALCRREQEIDEYIAKAKDQGYHTVLNLGTKGVNYATTVIMQTAIKGGGGLVQQLRKSYSLSDLSECEPREERASDEADDVLAEPRLIRRGGKSGYSTRRSASESNSRSPMYFPEVDVDVRGARSTRTDELDFSHIKSSEDISSGYSSADNSASLTRAASLNAAARARARSTRTNVTTIKRPQAAEENEVIIEELHDDDTCEYTNMPPLVNIPSPSPIFLSQSEPPFLYQYIGDQVRILQVLGKDPFHISNNKETDDNPNHRDQSEILEVENTQKNINEANIKKKANEDDANTNVVRENVGHTEHNISQLTNEASTKTSENTNYEEPCAADVGVNTAKSGMEDNSPPQTVRKLEDNTDTTSLDTSINDHDSAESDDEASFGTPEDSPKSKRKSPKGKYGKGKAPPPPMLEMPIDVTEHNNKTLDSAVSTTSQESLNDLVNLMQNTTIKESGMNKGLQVVNPIVEKKRRHKSKSPNRIPKAQGSGISRLLHLPNKLAFWHKADDRPKSDGVSPSECQSRRSSTIEPVAVDDFESCFEFSLENFADNTPNTDDDQSSFKDACDVSSDVITNDIQEKSEALQKLIEAKIESHPEYKIVLLHDEIPTTSKSTEV